MSDPVTNVEIEDVLSSIRRLVSEDARPSQDDNVDATPEKLVLTPAFRVPEVQEEEVALEEDAPDPVETLETGQSQDDIVAIADAIVADQGVQDAYQANAEAPEYFEYSSETEEASTSDEPQQDVGEQETSSVDPAPDDSSDDDENTWPVDDSSENSEPTSSADRVSLLQDAMTDQEETWSSDAASDSSSTGDTYVEDVMDLDAWEDVDDFDAAANTVPFVSRAVLNGDAEASVQDATIEEDPEVFLSDEAVLDEEALRDLVSELVREELQGALGERITRNVRKLVRREIHRALASMELE